ncbi:unnamed protein product [Adineta steineri]|uniref:Uncharacterized protein n=2 Tax=Adineta steineri TaxID=433720 RepID=A0A818IH89_9BILA|nr:unnamed protein product [Adineta steineri]CAF3524509.1 unnamed protein product [Adineta steineri]CAF3550153.1 unnamed protein product [Adineta steineri]
MIPMLPVCDSRAMLMPVNSGICGAPPVMVPMMPAGGAPLLCAPNNFGLCSTTSIMSEYNAQMYGRFQHVEREHPRYRHAPFDWYRPPKQRHNIVHEDAAVVTLDGPVPIGDFYRHYIYGDGYDDYDDYDDDDEYYDDDDDDDAGSFGSDEYDDTVVPSYEPRSIGYRRDPQRGPGSVADSYIPSNRSSINSRNYAKLDPTRRTSMRPSNYQRNRSLLADNDMDDAASINSTYGN